MVPHAFGVIALERLLEIVPRARAREERLANMEAQVVVICVEKPRRHVVAAAMLSFQRRRVEHVQPQQFDFVFSPRDLAPPRFAGANWRTSISGNPHTLTFSAFSRVCWPSVPR